MLSREVKAKGAILRSIYKILRTELNAALCLSKGGIKNLYYIKISPSKNRIHNRLPTVLSPSCFFSPLCCNPHTIGRQKRYVLINTQMGTGGSPFFTEFLRHRELCDGTQRCAFLRHQSVKINILNVSSPLKGNQIHNRRVYYCTLVVLRCATTASFSY